MRRLVTWGLVVLALVAWPAGAQQQDSIAAIRANPMRFWNREVTVAGLVGKAESSFPGGQVGTYRMVDYTDSTGIAISSDDLPAPGRVLRVKGIVRPSREDATIPIVVEKTREALDKPEWLLWVVVIAAVLAVGLGGALWYFLKRNPAEAPGVPEADAARPPVPIVIGGPVKMAPPPVYMPWANPEARASGAMPRPTLDGPPAPRGPLPGAGALPRTTLGGTPVVPEPEPATDLGAAASAAGDQPEPFYVRRPTVPVQRTVAPNPFALPPRPPARGAPVTQPFEPKAPRTEPFEYTGARLEVIEGPDMGRKLPIGSNTLFIGREGGRRNHFALTDPTVSTAQARILRDETFGWILENEGKTNVTMVNGEPAMEPVALEDGMEVRMGATLIRFKLGS